MLSRRSFLRSGTFTGAASLGIRMTTNGGGVNAADLQTQRPATIQSVTGRALELDRIKVSGWLAERLDRAFMALDNLSAAVWWNVIDTWGYTLPALWLRDAVLMKQYTGISHHRLDEVANLLITMQAAGKLRLDYRKSRIAVYEDAELIRGLVDYYSFARNPDALQAAQAVARIIAQNWRITGHYYNGLAIGPLLKLADASGESSFADLAFEIAEEEQLRCLKQEEGTHGAAASMILDFFLGLYERSGDRRYLDWALEGWKAIRQRMFVTGGIGEVLFFTKPPEESVLHDETCQTSWWFMFNVHLWRITGEIQYLDLAERILLNHFFFQQLRPGEGGGFHALGDVDQGFRGDHNYFCCDVEGPFGYFELLRHLYTCDAARRVVSVNFLFDSAATVQFGDGSKVRIGQKTRYPQRGAAQVTVNPQGTMDFTLRLRVPGWTRLGSVRINGQITPARFEGSYVSLTRTWKPGDMVDAVFPLPLRVEADNTGKGAPSVEVALNGQKRLAKRLGVLYGPLVAAIFRTGHNNDLSWVWTGDYPEILDSGGSVFEKYPASKDAELEQNGANWHSGGAAENTEVTAGSAVPTLRWSTTLGKAISVAHEVKVLPGMPLTLAYREEVRGWDGRGRLFCSGLRFATLKTNHNPSYRGRPNAWPYPYPSFTSKPDLGNVNDIVFQAGTFGRYERLEDRCELAKTGVAMLNNGYFRAISLYDPQGVARVSCRQTQHWVGIYLEPEAGEKTVLQRRIIYPLHGRPLSQTAAKQAMERAKQARASWLESGQLKLEGPAVEDVPILLPKALGLKTGSLLHNAKLASVALEYDAENLIVLADGPGTYQVERM